MHRSRVSQIKETLKQAIRNAPFRGQTEVVATDEETLNTFAGLWNTLISNKCCNKRVSKST